MTLKYKIKFKLDELKFRFQRFQKGYSDKDLWNMFDWFMEVTKPMLVEFRKTHHGSPATLGENYTNEDGLLVNDKCHEEWDAILDRMIFLITEMNEETCSMKNQYNEEIERWYEIENYNREPKYEKIHNLYCEREAEIIEYRDKCKDEFFELFSKWFWNLWD